MDKKKKIWIFAGVAAVIIIVLAAAALVSGSMRNDRINSGHNDNNNSNNNSSNDNSTQDNSSQNEGSGETADAPPITAMYVPITEDIYLFIGEESGVFTIHFPEEIYDIHGKKITKEQLAKGNIVKIYGNGIMAESYPGQYNGVTKLEVIEEGTPSDVDQYADIVDQFYQEPDPSQPPTLNVEYTTDLAAVTVMVNRGGYEWIYMDKDGLSNAEVADSAHVLQWGELLADLRLQEPADVTLSFSEEPQEVNAVRYDSALAGTEQENPEGENVTVEEKEGEFVLPGVTAGYIYEITGIWENGRATYGFITEP